MKQVLQQAEGAYPAAGHSPYQSAGYAQDADRVECDIVRAVGEEVLDCADGAGKNGQRTCITVQGGDTEALQRALVYRS